jgi:thermostable 8-oxoguanine DNA glycosylase
MRLNFTTSTQKRLEDTVLKLCSIIERNILADSYWTEYSLRRELVACILGSQVRYEMATVALERLEQAGLLDDEWWCHTEDKFELAVYEVLSGQTPRHKGNWCYRFPKARAHQLTEARNTITGQSLYKWLFDSSEPKHIRQRLVTEISGLGPKQASTLLTLKLWIKPL